MKSRVILKSESLKFESGDHYEDIEFSGVDFAAFSLKSISFLNCLFRNCNLANQSLTNALMVDIEFTQCNLIGINWCALKRLASPSFNESKLDYCSFQKLKLKGLVLKNCSALEVDFSETDLSASDFSGTRFGGANFDRSNLAGADFRLSRDYALDVRTAKIKGTKFALPDVMGLITLLGADVEF